MTASESAWAGSWVASRLGVRLSDAARPVGVGLRDLVGLAVRRNPRRAHLLVSTVLGKHVPTDPWLVYGSGLLLGQLVRARLRDEKPFEPGGLFSDALRDVPGASTGMRDLLRAPRVPVDAVVLGYAETATALGHSVADALGGAYYLHSTRRPVRGFATYGGFEEEHSHATSHLLLPSDFAALDRDVPVVLVDDELSTGRTVLNTVQALHAVRPRGHYVIAALVDLRGPAESARMSELADRLGTRIDTVALAGGSVELPDDILDAGQALVARLPAPAAAPDSAVGSFPVSRAALEWPAGLPDGGRHGFLPEHRERLEEELPDMAETVAAGLGGGFSRVLVLGFEELMYTPLRLAETLGYTLPDVDVRYSTTTRSPVLAVDDPGYAIRTRLVFPSHDEPADGPGERYAYNVLPPTGQPGFDRIVLVVDDIGDTPALADGLLRRLRAVAPVLVATVPARRSA
ncbi:phosphoribosyltransferase-like predicted ribonucleoside biosynthesis protein [Actinomadura pelletieri DSM 43383]|uniref:Phosphoribosyltransferase-like predicted ribonucleoside biosynthesis protein n=1 Tax=Actinomadura pelletieri DSM 43383 TaxID=1120940 RepID=A0A495QPD4_9ACTN|nr:phosphoribosyltransferase family protein [Actinomadura pelletieri]RKS74801.1 phosphoribosyltransferase-like predicted ribonucleoside biosynthesis protein [Actinomadura pelletieri DSM 43383]